MITVKTPLRISFLGGGSDLPEFSNKYGGEVVSMTISQYLWVSIRKRQDSLITLDSPLGYECCEMTEQIQHPLVRAVLKGFGIPIGGVSIWITSDVSAEGCGLGTSSALMVGLIYGLLHLAEQSCSSAIIAGLTAKLQLEIGGSGVQDAYACATGGLQPLCFSERWLCQHHTVGDTPRL